MLGHTQLAPRGALVRRAHPRGERTLFMKLPRVKLISGEAVMPKVKSSHLKRVEYGAKDRSLTIEFKNGDRYVYKDVPIRTYQELLNADSAGEHFASEIRDNYTGHKL